MDRFLFLTKVFFALYFYITEIISYNLLIKFFLVQLINFIVKQMNKNYINLEINVPVVRLIY